MRTVYRITKLEQVAGLTATKSGDGYTTTFPIGLDLSDTQVGQSDSNRP